MSGEPSVRFGVIGLGNIGQQHVELLQSGVVDGAKLTAVSARTDASGFDVPHFADYRALLASGAVDAVLIATPTMDHLEMGLAACEANLHVLMEKPAAMSVADARTLVAARRPERQFAVMLNQRFHPAYARIKELFADGRIGHLQRFGWTMTAWYRPDVYYRVSAWRGTWRGEGGGLLINQCIHNLDVLTWLTGLPTQVFSVCGFRQVPRNRGGRRGHSDPQLCRWRDRNRGGIERGGAGHQPARSGRRFGYDPIRRPNHQPVGDGRTDGRALRDHARHVRHAGVCRGGRSALA